MADFGWLLLDPLRPLAVHALMRHTLKVLGLLGLLYPLATGVYFPVNLSLKQPLACTVKQFEMKAAHRVTGTVRQLLKQFPR